MRIHEAITIFRKYGVNVADLPLDQIRRIRNALIQRHHPDVGGSLGITQEINAAFDLLRNITPDALHPAAQTRQPTEPPPEADPEPQAQPQPGSNTERVVRTDHDLYRKYAPDNNSTSEWVWEDHDKKPSTPEYHDHNRYRAPDNKWAWAGHFGAKPPKSAIAKNDFTDVNFIKRSMWELSRHSTDEWMISGYDGKSFSHNVIVYGSPGIFHYMAIAMIDLQTKGKPPTTCRAVFARLGTSFDLYLIYADGKYYDQKPVKIRHEAVGSNPKNYSMLMQKLPGLLDELRTQNE